MSIVYSNQLVLLRRLLEEQKVEPTTVDYVFTAMQKEFQRVDTDLPIGVNALILNEKNELLLSKRGTNVFCGGTRGLPGGHLQKEETFEEGIARECKEELGIGVDISDIYILLLYEIALEVGVNYKLVE